jgi:hypothetical protein
MATLTAIFIAAVVITVFSVLSAQARERKSAQTWRGMAISNDELRQVETAMRKHAKVDPTYRPRTIGGKR